MQKIILLMTLTFIFDAQARDLPGLISVISNDLEPKLSCEIDQNKNLSACLTQICGPAKKNKNVEDVLADLETQSESVKTGLPQLKSAIEKFYQEALPYHQDALANMDELLKNQQLQIKPEHQDLHKFSELISVIQDLPLDDMVNDYETKDARLILQLDQTKFENALTQKLGAPRAKRLSGSIKEFLSNRHFQKMLFGGSMGWTIFLEQNYPGLSLPAIIQLQTTRNQKTLQELKNKNPEMYEYLILSDIVRMKVLNRVQQEEHLSEKVLDDYFSSVLVFGLIEDYFLKAPREFAKFKPTSLLDFYNKDEITAEVKKRLAKFKQLNLKSPVIQQNHLHCQAILQKSQVGLPSHSERAAFIGQVHSYQQDFKSKILGKFSATSAGLLGPKIDDIKFDIPPSREIFSELLIDEIKSSTEDILKFKAAKNQDPSVKTHFSLLAFQDIMNTDEEKSLSSISEICDNYELGSLEDHSLQIGSGKIKVSWLSLKSPAVGKGIIAHELAHALSGLIQQSTLSAHSAALYKQSRQCLNQGFPPLGVESETLNYQQSGQTFSDRYQVNQFVEENWADSLAAVYLGPEAPNYACFLVDKNEDGAYSSHQFLPPDDRDTHAPSLYRILKIDFLKKGQLPAACLEQLSSVEKSTLENVCFK